MVPSGLKDLAEGGADGGPERLVDGFLPFRANPLVAGGGVGWGPVERFDACASIEEGFDFVGFVFGEVELQRPFLGVGVEAEGNALLVAVRCAKRAGARVAGFAGAVKRLVGGKGGHG